MNVVVQSERGVARPAWPGPRRHGFSLVELLIAASLACTMLAASWGWVWTTAASARRTDAGAQGATARAFAARMLRADLAASAGLCPPEIGVCGPTRLALQCRDPESGVARVVTVAWDPGRQVLWRNAAGSYLSEGVTSFAVRYFARDGGEIVPVDGALGLEARQRVRRVSMEWTTDAGATVVAGEIP